MIATLKQELRAIDKQLGELQKRKQSVKVQIAVASAVKREQIKFKFRQKITPIIQACIAKEMTWPEIATNLNNRGFRNQDKRWRGVAVEAIWVCR